MGGLVLRDETSPLGRALLDRLSELYVLLFAFGFFELLLLMNVSTDIKAHADYVAKIVHGIAPLPANFLYYISVFLISLGRVDTPSWLYFASAVILSLSVAAKFSLTYRLLADEFSPHPLGPSLAMHIAVALLIAVSLPMTLFLPQGHFYLGQITPNVWHNSTTIFLMPFALALFYRSDLPRI